MEADIHRVISLRDKKHTNFVEVNFAVNTSDVVNPFVTTFFYNNSTRISRSSTGATLGCISHLV